MTQRDKNNHQDRRKRGAGGLARPCRRGSSRRRVGRRLSGHLCVGQKQAQHGYVRSGHRFSQGCLDSLERLAGAGGGAQEPGDLVSTAPLESGIRCGHWVGRGGRSLAGHSGG